MQEIQTTLPVGSVLRDRYVIESLLGKGGFGAVYCVRDLRVKGNMYALKEVIEPQRKVGTHTNVLSSTPTRIPQENVSVVAARTCLVPSQISGKIMGRFAEKYFRW